MVLALQACAGSQQLIGLTHHAPKLLDSLIHHTFAALRCVLLATVVPNFLHIGAGFYIQPECKRAFEWIDWYSMHGKNI